MVAVSVPLTVPPFKVAQLDDEIGGDRLQIIEHSLEGEEVAVGVGADSDAHG